MYYIYKYMNSSNVIESAYYNLTRTVYTTKEINLNYII